MALDPARTPVLLGIGQSLERDGVTTAVDLAARAAEAAFDDAPGLRDRIQRLSLVAVSFSPASPVAATEIGDRLGLHGVAREITTPGGHSPQWLVNRACEEITRGTLETTILVGAEATRSMKLAEPDRDFLRVGFDGREEGGPEDEVVGSSVLDVLGPAEIEAKLYWPAVVYPIFESALAARTGTDPAGSRERIAAFLARASEVAATNPMAWFQEVRTAEAIATATPANRITAEPYTKCMNAFAQVDQGSALIVTTLAIAQGLGLADQAVFPRAGASASDLVPVERADLGASPAIRAAAAATFSAAGVGLDDIDTFDLYSCFPVAVQVGANEIGLALDDPRGFTRTGGMSFFGGPGNNYTSHGIASTALRLREAGGLGYVAAVGGVLSKHAVGVYASEAPGQPFRLADTSAEQQAIADSARPVALEAEGEAVVDGGTVVYDREDRPKAAPIIATLEDGRRVVATARPELLPSLAGRTLVGETVRVSGGHPPVYDP